MVGLGIRFDFDGFFSDFFSKRSLFSSFISAINNSFVFCWSSIICISFWIVSFMNGSCSIPTENSSILWVPPLRFFDRCKIDPLQNQGQLRRRNEYFGLLCIYFGLFEFPSFQFFIPKYKSSITPKEDLTTIT